MKEELKCALQKIRFLVFDFDGVMTDNRVLVSQDGTEAVFCNRSDGIGIELLRKAGYGLLILSSEKNPVVRARAKKLKLEIIHDVEDKLTVLKGYCTENRLKLSEICYTGNDVNDLAVMEAVGFGIAPADAHWQILKIADVVTSAKGGYGVIREIADLMLMEGGKDA